MLSLSKKPYYLTLILSIYMILFFTAPGICGMVESTFNTSDIKLSQNERMAKIQTIQRALENKIVQDKLQAYNLSDKEIKEKLQNAPDAQIHILAQASEKVLAGGDSLSLLVTLLVIVLLVILILRLT